MVQSKKNHLQQIQVYKSLQIDQIGKWISSTPTNGVISPDFYITGYWAKLVQMGSVISSITETTRLLSTCLQREYPTVPNTPCSWLATVRFVERLPGGSLPTARVGFGNDVQMHVNIRVDWSCRIFSLVAVF